MTNPSTDFKFVVPEEYMEFIRKHELHRSDEQLKIKYQIRAVMALTDVYPAFEELGATTADTYLDIGCGIGGPSAWFAHIMKATKVHLIDGSDGAAPRSSGWNEEAKAWNDVMVAKKIVQANVGKDVEVIAHYAGCPITEFRPLSLDLITSFRSWGHHYNVPTYTALAQHALKPNGLILLDVRNKTKGIDQMNKAGFAQVVQVPNHSKKCERWIFKRA